MFNGFVNWLKQQRERAELEKLGRCELDRVAHDLGLSIDDLGNLIDAAHDPKQLSDMLKALKIDEHRLAYTQPALLRDMQRSCGLCEAAGECQDALDAGTAAEHYREFCRNADTLDTLGAAAEPKSERGQPRAARV